MQEEWKTVPLDKLSHYEISTYGNVRLLPRDVQTHIVNRGRDMIVTAKRKGKNIKPNYEAGRPLIRMLDADGHRRKFSLPLLMLKTFKFNECPGDVDKYTAAYLDGDNSNNRLDNLVWVSKSALMSSISKTIKGESHDYLKKYEYYVIKVYDTVVGYFNGTTEGADLFNSYGFETSSSALGRCLNQGTQFFFMFDLIPVDALEYNRISLEHEQMNLKSLYDIVMEDRRHSRKSSIENLSPRKVRTKTVVKKEIVYKDKIVKVPEKQIVEKIVYVDKQSGEKVRKPRTINKSVPKTQTIEKSVETNVTKVDKVVPKKVSKSTFSNPNWDKDLYEDVDTLDLLEPSDQEIKQMQVENDRERFKRELLRRLGK